ncbi:MAG: NAD(P)-binding protein [Planctomycetales bacterium]|nr:NAD(P)-binding protein [Planctomycetales bacterium]
MSTDALSQLLSRLPPALRERCRPLNDHAVDTDGDFVLYWMATAVRTDENPALESAVALANQLRLSPLIYQALSQHAPYASDRLHTFLLEGARDVAIRAAARKIPYIFHLERPGSVGPHLHTLAARAAVVVVEEMPVEPGRKWARRLAAVAPCAVVAVDAACIAPMQSLGQAYERAFEFRDAARALWEERLDEQLGPVAPVVPAREPLDLPFAPVDVARESIADLVAQCDIDHSVGPVAHTRGGSLAAYDRWNRFRDADLKSYADRRNDAALNGVSRMSPYLHYGMASPFRLAREAAEQGGAGAEKFLDELLTWRELAFGYCFHKTDHDLLTTIPAWAQQTLAEHASDPRPELLSWETLARGKTGDPLWDAAQTSLLRHGELHNNVRMTWGKTLLQWTPDAAAALRMMIDLNHRYALDGRDPASYGGILWCLGQFDRPFRPAQPIVGVVRPRPTDDHRRRLDLTSYQAHVRRSLVPDPPRVAVIGAGIAGLAAARTLVDHGLEVHVFEKSRGVGGRTATRRVDDQFAFDHGAQYFTARDARFRRHVDSWLHDGVVQRWDGRVVSIVDGKLAEDKTNDSRFVGTPTMSAICRHLAGDLQVRLQSRVLPLQRHNDKWRLTAEDSSLLGDYDWAIVSAPAEQTAQLIEACPNLSAQANAVVMQPCWALMLALERPSGISWDAAFVDDDAVRWAARNNSKPHRSPVPETWVVHATPGWTQKHWDLSADEAAQRLTTRFGELTGLATAKALHAAAHRWRYALAPEVLSQACLFDATEGLAACGDWCGGPRVEGAYLSGVAAAGRLLGLLSSATGSLTKAQ